MIVDKVLAKVFGIKNEREIKSMQPSVAAVGELEPAIRQLSDAELAQKTIEFKERIAQGASLDDLMVEAFAVVREGGSNFRATCPGKAGPSGIPRLGGAGEPTTRGDPGAGSRVDGGRVGHAG